MRAAKRVSKTRSGDSDGGEAWKKVFGFGVKKDAIER